MRGEGGLHLPESLLQCEELMLDTLEKGGIIVSAYTRTEISVKRLVWALPISPPFRRVSSVNSLRVVSLAT